MIFTDGKNGVSREKLQRMLCRLSKQAVPEEPVSGATEFDWTTPHHFGPEAGHQLEGLSRRVTLAFQKCFEEATQKAAEVMHNRTCEHYANRLSEQLAVPTGPYMATVMNESQRRIGFFLIPFETAVFLVAQTLHDPEAAVGQDGQFSALEESILADILTLFTDALAAVLGEYAQVALRSGQPPLRGEWRIDARDLDDLCELSYLMKWKDQFYPFSFVLESGLLDSFAGQPVYFKTLPPEKTRACLLEQVRRAPVLVKAVICAASLHFRELVELEPGDVLLLGKKIREPMDVLVNGQFCFQAYPACQDGKAALVITEQQEI